MATPAIVQESIMTIITRGFFAVLAPSAEPIKPQAIVAPKLGRKAKTRPHDWQYPFIFSSSIEKKPG